MECGEKLDPRDFYPAAEEESRLIRILDEAPAEQKGAVLEDIYWAVLSSKEFLFNH